jgi:multidrug transporter EmrE-like cation transporter
MTVAPRSFEGYFFVFLTLALTIFGQLVIKWQVSFVGAAPDSPMEKLAFLFAMFTRPWVMSGLASALLASFCWMLALTRLPLSAAYPWMSLAFVGVILLSAPLFGESLSTAKLVGMGLLVAGITLLSRD